MPCLPQSPGRTAPARCWHERRCRGRESRTLTSLTKPVKPTRSETPSRAAVACSSCSDTWLPSVAYTGPPMTYARTSSDCGSLRDCLEKYVVPLPYGEGREEADADDVAAAGGKARETIQIESRAARRETRQVDGIPDWLNRRQCAAQRQKIIRRRSASWRSPGRIAKRTARGSPRSIGRRAT